MPGKSKTMNMNDIVEKGKVEKVKVLLSISTGEINRLFVNSLCEITKSKKYNIEVRMCGENESNASVLEGFSRMEECPFELIIFIKPCVGFSQESIENMIQRTISDKYKKIYGLSVPRGNLAFEHMESVKGSLSLSKREIQSLCCSFSLVSRSGKIEVDDEGVISVTCFQLHDIVCIPIELAKKMSIDLSRGFDKIDKIDCKLLTVFTCSNENVSGCLLEHLRCINKINKNKCK